MKKSLFLWSLLLTVLLLASSVSSRSNTLTILPKIGSVDGWEWTPIEVVSVDSMEDSIGVSMVIDNLGNLHVVWSEGDSDDDIMYRKYNAQTSNWEDVQLISTETVDSAHSPTIAADGLNNIHVAWADNSGGDIDIWYKKYDSILSSWGVSQLISNDSTGFAARPDLAIDSMNNLHLVWYDSTDYLFAGSDEDIIYKKFDFDSGQWLPDVLISSLSTDISLRPAIAVDNLDNVHIVWSDVTNFMSAGTDWDIFHRKYRVGSESWSEQIVLSTESAGLSDSPDIAVDGLNNLHVAWYDGTNYGGAGNDYDIFYKKFVFDESKWGSTTVVSTESDATSFSPNVKVDKANNVHIAWSDGSQFNGVTNEDDIFYKNYNVQGSVWSSTFVVSETNENSVGPVMGIDESQQIHIVWQDEEGYKLAESDEDIFYKRYGGLPLIPNLYNIEPNPSQGKVNLQWSTPHGAVSYNVYRADAPIYSIDGLTPIGSTSAPHYVDTLEEAGDYFYAVTAVNINGEGTPSDTQHVKIEASGDPEEVTVVVSDIVEIYSNFTKTESEGLPIGIIPVISTLFIGVAYRVISYRVKNRN